MKARTYPFAVGPRRRLLGTTLAVAAVAVLLAVPGPAWAATATFAAPAHYTPVGSAGGIAQADFDGDGDKDMAVTDADHFGTSEDVISVLLNRGDGAFGAGTDYVVGDTPSGIASADLDGDGDRDLAVTNYNSGRTAAPSDEVSVLLNNGDGTFGGRTDHAAGSAPNDLTVADFDGDGDGDLAVANRGSDAVSVLLGNGDGTFETETDYPAGYGPRDVTRADLNGDDRLDLAVTNGYSGISVLLGGGDGTFGAPTGYDAPKNAWQVEAADFDGDGDGDLATTNYFSESVEDVSVLPNKGDGTFGPPVSYDLRTNQAYGITSADLDGDGVRDLAVTSRNDQRGIWALSGGGDGAFGAPTRLTSAFGYEAIGSADLNGDGKPDLAAGADEGVVSVLLNTTEPGTDPDPDPAGCTIEGTAGADTLVGTSGPDVVCGRAGGDTIRGLGGGDTVLGNRGNDTVYGGGGRDTVRGGNGRDALTGGGGGDDLHGQNGDDRIYAADGTGGNDLAHGGPQDDTCRTDAGDGVIGCER